LPIPRDGEVDPLTQAEAALVPAKSKKNATKNAKGPIPSKAHKTNSKQTSGKKLAA